MEKLVELMKIHPGIGRGKLPFGFSKMRYNSYVCTIYTSNYSWKSSFWEKWHFVGIFFFFSHPGVYPFFAYFSFKEFYYFLQNHTDCWLRNSNIKVVTAASLVASISEKSERTTQFKNRWNSRTACWRF